MRKLISLWCLLLSLLANGAVLESFNRITLDSSPDNPAYITVADIKGDSRPEVIVTMFGKSPMGSGSVYIYSQRDKGFWVKERLAYSNVKFPNSPTIADVDGDGRKDIILPGGFLPCTKIPFGYCGSLQWYRQTNSGGFERNRLFHRSKYFYHHMELVDFDYDGTLDLVGVAEEKSFSKVGSSRLEYFKGIEGPLMFETKPRYVTEGLGSFPRVLDLDDDGRWEVYSSEYFGSKGSFSWVKEGPQGQWQRNYLDASVGQATQLSFVDDLFGDGKLWAIGSNHTNTKDDRNAPESAVYAYRVPHFGSKSFDPSASWDRIKLSEGIVSRKSGLFGPQGAPGVFAVGDVDGDGDKDIVVSGDGDPRIILLRQIAGAKFETLTLDGDMPQGGVAVHDLDGDGVDEIVASSYENNRLYIYKFR